MLGSTGARWNITAQSFPLSLLGSQWKVCQWLLTPLTWGISCSFSTKQSFTLKNTPLLNIVLFSALFSGVPHFLLEPSDVAAFAGEPFNLTCAARGPPDPVEVLWWLGGEQRSDFMPSPSVLSVKGEMHQSLNQVCPVCCRPCPQEKDFVGTLLLPFFCFALWSTLRLNRFLRTFSKANRFENAVLALKCALWNHFALAALQFGDGNVSFRSFRLHFFKGNSMFISCCSDKKIWGHYYSLLYILVLSMETDAFHAHQLFI